MRKLSAEEVRRLGHQFDIEIDDREEKEIAGTVNSFLEGLDAVYDVSASETVDRGTTREWWRPSNDPLNAIATYCDVGPYDDHDGRLDGLEIAIKDNISVGGVPLGCASPLMRGYVPGHDATIVDRLRSAGARVTAKANLDEMAAGPWGEAADGQISNPHDPDCVAGGSSGGSAVAVATGIADVGIGTDTGGSVRIPASFCGVVGLKPTYGLVPLRGVVENTYTQDHVGPITSTVADAARVLDAIAGPDELDPSSAAAAAREDYRRGEYEQAVDAASSVSSLTIGRVTDGFGDGVQRGVEETVESTVESLAGAGANVVDIDIDGYRYVDPIKDVLSYTELAAHWRAGGLQLRRGGVVDEGFHAAFEARRNRRSGELGVHYKSKLLAGARLLTASGGDHYAKAQIARTVVAETVESTFHTVDVLALPTMAGVAPARSNARNPGFAYGRNTRLANVTKHPAITLPCGNVEGLPVGFQMIGPLFGEETLLKAAHAVETTVSEST